MEFEIEVLSTVSTVLEMVVEHFQVVIENRVVDRSQTDLENWSVDTFQVEIGMWSAMLTVVVVVFGI